MIILASGSPRRRELMEAMGLDFVVDTRFAIDENVPSEVPVGEVAEYLARKKAAAYPVGPDDVVVTADTVVIVGGDECGGAAVGAPQILGKPRSRDEAVAMLQRLSGATHKVVTGVCVSSVSCVRGFSVTTLVTFRNIGLNEIEYYVDTFQPFDKAGAYGIQEWSGTWESCASRAPITTWSGCRQSDFGPLLS